ncbi:unnamed protein product [Rhizophagus irregularis]|nr:unnamed protein product [Rhizophagus irregularis]
MADSETDQEEMEEEIDEENNGDESEVSEVEEDEENDTRPSSRNTNKRSWVWGHFKYEDSLKKAKCDYCKSLICCNKGSTTGLSNHLKSKHNITKNQEKNQLTIHEVINNSEAIVYSKETFRKFLIEWIVKNDLPFTCVESEDFRSMICLLRKDAFIPSADTIKNDIISIFDESKKKINSILQILGVTTDNASNNITFLQAVEDELSKKFIRFESKDKHVRCLAHVMNLAAQQALTTLKAIEDNEPSNENSGDKSIPQQQEKFKAQCKVANISNLNVILDVRTRWNSTHDMLMRARTLKEPINTLSNSDQNLRALSINEEEWVRLSEIEELLKCFAKATKQICGETYPTLSYAIPIYNILLNKLEDFRDTPNRFENGKEAAINAINKLKEYYNKTDTTLYTVSLILDPRLKLEYMKDNEWEKCWIDKTKNDVSEIYNTLYAPKEIQNTRIECELDRYLKADRAQPLTNVLKWWKLHEEEYPHLANMAKDYLGVPATSAPSERIFSSAADVITYDRASLAPETVRSVMCLKHWYRSGLLA